MFSHLFGLQQIVGPGGGILSDPYWSYVTLLMHLNGANGSTSFPEETTSGVTFAAGGNGQISTAQYKFGGAALKFDGTGDYILSTTGFSALTFGTGDFTVEMWVYLNKAQNMLIDFGWSGSSGTWQFYTNATGHLEWYHGIGAGGTVLTGSDVVSTGSWHYVAAKRASGTFSLWLDGVSQGSVADSRDYNASAVNTGIKIGGQVVFNASWDANGYYDEIRVTKGYARDVSSVPTGPFNTSSTLTPPSVRCLPRGTLTTTFSVVARPSLFAVTGVLLGSTTLATVTSSDASLTAVVLDEHGVPASIPGLTFNYAAGVLSVSGTPTGDSKVYSIAVCYRSSDGTYRSVGSSLHDITIANASDVLTIGSMVNPSIRQGQYSSTTILSPTTNFAVGLLAVPRIAVPGMDVVLSWTIGSSSGSGSVRLSGTPTVAGSYTLKIDYYTSDGTVLLGTSTHTVAVSAAYVSPPAPPAPSPGPSPPAPSPPPAPTPAPQPGHGPDSYFSSVKALLHFDDASNIAKDQISSNTWTNAQTQYVSGAVVGAGGFSSSSKLSCAISGVEGLSGLLTVELMFDIDSVAWDALTADGTDFRWCPISCLVAQDGSVLWALGLFSYYSSYYKIRQTRAGFYMPLLSLPGDQTFVQPFGPVIPARPNKFMHLAGAIKPRPGGVGFDHVGCVWLNGDPGLGSSLFLASRRVTKTGRTVLIGGSDGSIPAYYGGQSNIVNFSGKIDEYRLTAEARYASYMDFTALAIPEVARTIPWSNS
jgi:hypothetical protein